MPVDDIYIVPVLLAGAYYTGTILGPLLCQYPVFFVCSATLYG